MLPSGRGTRASANDVVSFFILLGEPPLRGAEPTLTHLTTLCRAERTLTHLTTLCRAERTLTHLNTLAYLHVPTPSLLLSATQKKTKKNNDENRQGILRRTGPRLSHSQHLAYKCLASLGAHEWRPKMKGQKGIRILCFDGGGTRGVLTLALLKHVEKVRTEYV